MHIHRKKTKTKTTNTQECYLFLRRKSILHGENSIVDQYTDRKRKASILNLFTIEHGCVQRRKRIATMKMCSTCSSLEKKNNNTDKRNRNSGKNNRIKRKRKAA
jgi:hypothetical protein